jgi:hypothetical protein
LPISFIEADLISDFREEGCFFDWFLRAGPEPQISDLADLTLSGRPHDFLSKREAPLVLYVPELFTFPVGCAVTLPSEALAQDT